MVTMGSPVSPARVCDGWSSRGALVPEFIGSLQSFLSADAVQIQPDKGQVRLWASVGSALISSRLESFRVRVCHVP